MHARNDHELSGVVVTAAHTCRFESGRVMENRPCRGISLLGYIDERRNRLLEITDREVRA